MSTRELQAKVSAALASKDIHIQNSAIMSLVGEVRQYVEQIIEEDRIISEISNYERRVSQLRRDKDNPDAASELEEAQKLLADANQIRRTMERKKQTVRNLKKDVEALHRELQRI
tara:strand:+ start:211 stop:555 length:345 start_codon:yes stop_codon:yes gene_type:complete